MAMAASLHALSLTPQTLSLHRSSSPAAASLFAPSPSSFKPLPKLLSFQSNYGYPISRLVRNVAISSELEEEVEDEPNFAPELKLFVGNLPFNIDSSGLAGLFEQAGNVEMVEVIYDKNSGRSRGFGFVTMSSIEEVVAAVQQFNGYEVEGRVLRVNSGPPPRKKETSSFRSPRGGGGGSFDNSQRVYVGNLAWGVDDLALETLFSEHGKVREATVVYDRESGRSRGFGFVSYSSAAEVENAIQSLDGMDVKGRSIRVSRAEARSRRDF